MEREIEAKFLKVDKELLRQKLKSLGFVLKEPEHLMVRVTFSLPGVSMEIKWARVRKEYQKVTMALKEVTSQEIVGTKEVEVEVDDFERAVTFLKEIGLYQKAWQENKREKWEKDGVEVTIDTWPGLEPFCEIEGPDRDTVENIAGLLGFNMEDALFGSVAKVYERELGIPYEVVVHLPEITFSNPPQKQTK